MNKPIYKLIICSVLAITLFAGCAVSLPGFGGGNRPTSAVETIGAGGNGSNRRQGTQQSEDTPTPLPTVVPKPTKTPTPDASPSTEAEKTVTAYFAALQAQDFETASQLVSNFSLLAAGIIRTDVVNQLNTLKASGTKWENLRIKESQVLDNKTVMVHVVYNQSGIDPKSGVETIKLKDELWPVRLEVGNWLYNWNNLIDFHTLVVTEQVTAGIIVKPLQLMRYSDHIGLVMLVQNTTGDTVVWGLRSENLSTFYFNGTPVIGDQSKKYVLNPLRTVPDLTIIVYGFFPTYPEKVDIRTWINYKVPPWYSFILTE